MVGQKGRYRGGHEEIGLRQIQRLSSALPSPDGQSERIAMASIQQRQGRRVKGRLSKRMHSLFDNFNQDMRRFGGLIFELLFLVKKIPFLFLRQWKIWLLQMFAKITPVL